MASRTADEREQRRGLILGLTLAEVLLLLLFLLLLVLSSQIRLGVIDTSSLMEHSKS